MNSSDNKRMISCPRCKQPAVYSPENAFRPFCSERCKLIDLGEWASESYRVPDKNISHPGENEDSIDQKINPDDEQDAGIDDLH